jgi:hypothetical protein
MTAPQLDLDAMNADLRAKFEKFREQCPGVDPKLLWKTVKATVLAGKVCDHLTEKGKSVTPEVMAKAFVECLKHMATL